METLKQLCAKHKKGDWPDKDSTHSYIEVYEELLRPYRLSAINILEIGLMSGESLRMWEDYFDGEVWGMDCSETPVNGLADLHPIIAEGTHNIIIGDATNAQDILDNFQFIKFNVIIDDGSHEINAQLKSYEILRNHLAKGGIYIIEDVQDIDRDAALFKNVDPNKNIYILDRRGIKGRYDDVLIVITDESDLLFISELTSE